MEPLRILVVCTANICRSPVVERHLARQLSSFGVAAEVGSAGTIGGQLQVHRHTLAAANNIDIDLSDHESRLLTRSLIRTEGRDLIIAMTADHMVEIVALEPDALARSFTLTEIASRAREFGPDPLATDIERWIESISGGRSHTIITSHDYPPIDDPYGGPASGHRAMVVEVTKLISDIVVPLAASVYDDRAAANDGAAAIDGAAEVDNSDI